MNNVTSSNFTKLEEPLQPGDEVYWNDPNNKNSGWYFVLERITPEIVFLRNPRWTMQIEVFETELS